MKKNKMLIVDPNPDLRETIRWAVEQVSCEKWNMVSAPHFEDAVEVAGNHPDADIAFVSYDAPNDGQGGSIAQQIKRQNPNLRVILMSSIAIESEADRMGLDGFLAKLGDQPPLSQRIEQALGPFVLAQCHS